MGPPYRTVKTDAAGNYELYLPPGRYCLTAVSLCETSIAVVEKAQIADVEHHVFADRALCDYDQRVVLPRVGP